MDWNSYGDENSEEKGGKMNNLKTRKKGFILFLLLCLIILPRIVFTNTEEKINWNILNEDWDNMGKWDWVHKTGNIFEVKPKGELHIYGEDKTDYSILRLKEVPSLPENYVVEIKIKCIKLADNLKEGFFNLDIRGKKTRTVISFGKDAIYYYFRKSSFGIPVLNQWQVWRFIVDKNLVKVFCDGKILGVWEKSKVEEEKETIEITGQNVEVYVDYLRISSDLIGATATIKQIINIDEAIRNNLVKNGDFEMDVDNDGIPDNWFSGSFSKYFSLDTSIKSSGTKSWKVKGGGVVYASCEIIPVIPSCPYTLIFDIRQMDIPIGFKEGGMVEIRWYLQGNEYTFQKLELIEGNFEWNRKIYVVESPENAISASIYLEKRGSSGETWYDNVIFAPGILKLEKEKISFKDRAKIYIVFENLLIDLRQFMIFKEPFLSSELINEYKEIEVSIKNFLEKIKLDSGDYLTFEKYLKENKKEIIFQEMLKGKYAFLLSLAEPYYEDWRNFTFKIEKFKNQSKEFLKENQPEKIKSSIKKLFGNNADYGVGITSTLQKILKNEPYCGPITDKVKISLSKGEHEGFQIILIPLEKDLKNVKVMLDDLKGQNGEIIESKYIKVFQVGYVETNKPEYNVDYVGLWPDPLLIKETFSVEKGEYQPIWIDVFIPENKNPGIYKGEIVISPANSHQLKVKLEVKVWNYIIPKKGNFKVFGRFRPDRLKDFYKWDTIPEDILLKWYLFFVEHRWSPTDIFATYMLPDGDILKECLKEGLNIINISNISQLLPYDRNIRKYSLPDEKTKEKIASILKANIMTLKKYNALDIAYIFCFDEQHDISQYPLMAEVLSFIKSVAPEVKIATTTTYPPIEKISNVIDTWIPLLGSESKEIEERKKAGNEVFFYIYGHPYHPFPNASLIDYPALDGRISFWIAADRGWTGFLHWYLNGWEVNCSEDKRWPEIPWKPYAYPSHKNRNGEGYFVYPGPNGEPLSSIRFENIRDGIEDWESIYILKDLSKKIDDEKEKKVVEDILKEIKQLVPEEYNYDPDPQHLLLLREKIGDEIEKLISIIKLNQLSSKNSKK